MGDRLAPEPEVFLLYEGGEVTEELKNELTCVRVAPHVTCIKVGAFFNCKKLVEVHLNEGLQIIGKYAFAGCSALRRVTLPSTLTELYKGALNEGLRIIGKRAFRGCGALGSFTLPSTVMKLGDEAFCNCISLAKVRLNEGLKTIGDGAFANCIAFRSVAIPSTVTKLGDSVFFNCSNLAKVQLNEGLQVVGACTFLDCKSLQNVTLPPTVTELGASAFHGCSMLTEVQFNEGLQIIGKYAFFQCTSLKSVTLPSSVTKLGQCTFFGCSNLAEVILLGGERLLNQEFFARGFSDEEWGLLNQGGLHTIIGEFSFARCQELRTVKISPSWALSERMKRLPPKCRVSVVERIRGLHRLELTQDGSVFACFPFEDWFGIQDTNNKTARSVYKVLQLIAFHELKESSILIELVWKSRIDEDRERADDSRVTLPCPPKSLIIEYCGYAGLLRPAMEGA